MNNKVELFKIGLLVSFKVGTLSTPGYLSIDRFFVYVIKFLWFLHINSGGEFRVCVPRNLESCISNNLGLCV